MSLQLALGAEAAAAVGAGELLHGEVHAQVVLHGQPVGVGGVAHIAVVLAGLVQVLVVGQAAGVPVGASALVTGERAPTLGVVGLWWARGARRLVGLLEALVLPVLAVLLLLVHVLAVLAVLPVLAMVLVLPRVLDPSLVHGLHLGRTPLVAAPVGIHALAGLVLGAVFLVEPQVIDQLLLDLESLPALLALVPTTESNTHTESGIR